jgi:hypothetical protein
MVKQAFRNLGAVKGADHLADADDTLIWRKVRDLDRLIMGARHLPLARPVSPKLGFAVQPGAAIGPVNVRSHEGKQGVAVPVGCRPRKPPAAVLCSPVCPFAENARFHDLGRKQPLAVRFRKKAPQSVVLTSKTLSMAAL